MPDRTRWRGEGEDGASGSFMRCGATAVSRERNCRWRLARRRYTAPGMKNIVILISGRGSNMEAIAKACADEGWNARIAAVVSNRPDAAGLAFAIGARHPGREPRSPVVRDRARRSMPSSRRGSRRSGPTSSRWPASCGSCRRRSSSASKAASSTSIRRCCPRLPACTRTVARIEAGCKVSGATIHFVTPVLDHGPIIAQAIVPVQRRRHRGHAGPPRARARACDLSARGALAGRRRAAGGRRHRHASARRVAAADLSGDPDRGGTAPSEQARRHVDRERQDHRVEDERQHRLQQHEAAHRARRHRHVGGLRRDRDRERDVEEVAVAGLERRLCRRKTEPGRRRCRRGKSSRSSGRTAPAASATNRPPWRGPARCAARRGGRPLPSRRTARRRRRRGSRAPPARRRRGPSPRPRPAPSRPASSGRGRRARSGRRRSPGRARRRRPSRCRQRVTAVGTPASARRRRCLPARRATAPGGPADGAASASSQWPGAAPVRWRPRAVGGHRPRIIRRCTRTPCSSMRPSCCTACCS